MRLFAAGSSGLISLDGFAVTSVAPSSTVLGLDPASSLLDQPHALSIPSMLPQAVPHSVCRDEEDEHTSGACEVRLEPHSDVSCVDETAVSPPASTDSLALMLATNEVDGEFGAFARFAYAVSEPCCSCCSPVSVLFEVRVFFAGDVLCQKRLINRVYCFELSSLGFVSGVFQFFRMILFVLWFTYLGLLNGLGRDCCGNCSTGTSIRLFDL